MLAASSVQAEQMLSQPQEQQGGAPQGNMMMQPAQMDPQMMANRKAEEELELKNRKEEMLLRIDNRMAMLQKEKSCIEAATNREALRSCKPEGPTPGGEGMMMQGGGMMGGGRGMMQNNGGMMMGSPHGQGIMGAPATGAPSGK